jgi:hypothetical protein
MRLSNAGYLGIGTNGPSAPLSVCTPSGGGLEIVPSSGGDFVITQTFNRATGQYIENAFRGSFLSFYTGQTTTERMRITAAGDVGIGNASPGATLDVNGTLKVGNFGGSTNVMPKPQHSTAGAVGHIMPYTTLWSSSIHTPAAQNGIPAGTWLINLVWVENSDLGAAPGDRDIQAIMCKVITVPAGQFFYIATNTEQANPPSGAGSTNPPPIYMKFATTATITPPSSPNTLSSWTNATWYQVKTGAGIPEAEAKQEDGTLSSFYGYVENTTGIIIAGQNTGLGPGYGYIQRLA